MPDPTSPPHPATALADERVGPAFAAARAAIAAHGARLLASPGVVSVQPGYRFANGWITREPAVVVSVLPEADRAHIPATLDGVLVDVTAASPLEQLHAAGQPEVARAALARGPVPAFPAAGLGASAELSAAAAALVPTDLHYTPPPDLPLAALTDAMTLTCHVSPDAGWPTLRTFLQEVRERLTVAMYDFTAPHILDAVQQTPGTLGLILDPTPAPGLGQPGPKAHDLQETTVTARLAEALGDRFTLVWAAEGSGRIFATAYHIKVAVRDDTAFWLSSGNWQSSNQPDIDPLASGADTTGLLATYDRDWHVVVEHPGLAALYRQYITWDMQQATPYHVEPSALALPDLWIPEPPALAEALAPAPPRFFPPLHQPFTADSPLRVQPLLTPDNYAEQVLQLIQSAQDTLYLQNQYISLTQNNPPRFEALVRALRDKMAAGLDVRIILRDLGDVRRMLSNLQAFGLDVSKVKLQPNCHAKGLVVDGKVVMVGSHNWSGPGTTANRDASLILFAPGLAGYFEQVFLYDWTHLAHQRLPTMEAAPTLAPPGAPTPPGMRRIAWSDYYPVA